MKMYDEIVKKILENGRQSTVRIGDQILPATEFKGYYVIATQNGLRIFDGEHIIEPDFRVFDVHLKQYIYYEHPVERLLETFGVDRRNVRIEKDVGTPVASEYPPKVMIMKLVIGVVWMAMFIGILRMVFAGNKSVYYLMFALGVVSLIDAIIDKKYLKKFDRVGLGCAIAELIIGLYGIIFVL